MRTKRIVIIGAGGMAREIAWIVRDLNRVRAQFEFVGYITTDPARLGNYDTQEHRLGGLEWIVAHPGEVDCVTVGIADGPTRLEVATTIRTRFSHLEWPNLVHPSVTFDAETARMGQGIVMCPHAAGTVHLVLDDYALVNTGVTLGHEAHLGRGCVVNPGANIGGGVTIGEAALVGTGAQVLQYLNVGARATVGAGAVVTKDVAPDTTVVGVPARPMQRKKQPS